MKIFCYFVFFIFICLKAAAFSMPQQNFLAEEPFYSYFGQLRGGTISNSLIFSEVSKIKAAGSGYITIILKDFSDDTDFFPSALGDAVIIGHKDSILSVYGNMDETSVPESLFLSQQIEEGNLLGKSGNSAWQEGKSGLEFQVIDTKNNVSINPRILMQRSGKEAGLYITGVSLLGKNNRFAEAAKQNSFQPGSYKVYQKRQTSAMPYKTRISINGIIVDELSYDLLRQDGNTICVSGKKNYPKSLLYPEDNLILLGEAIFTPGYNTLQISLIDILGKETNASYTLAAY